MFHQFLDAKQVQKCAIYDKIRKFSTSEKDIVYSMHACSEGKLNFLLAIYTQNGSRNPILKIFRWPENVENGLKLAKNG